MNDSPLKLLLIEADPAGLYAWRAAVTALDRQQFRLEPANGVPDLELPADVTADAILLRLSGPGADAVEMVQQLCNCVSDVPVIVLAAEHDPQQMAVQLLRAGAADYLNPDQASAETLGRTIRFAIERNRSQTVLLENEETWRRYEFIVNNSKEFMTLVNRNYVYEAVNESYCKAHDKSRNEIVGKTVAQVWGEGRYLHKIKEPLDQCFAGEEVYFQGWLGFSALGERYMQVTYYPYHNAEGVVSHIVVVSRDVTERKRAEEALHQAHSQNEQLLASIPSILIGVDSDDHVTHLNRPSEEAFGITAADVIGAPFRDSKIAWDWNQVLNRVGEGRRATTSVNLHDVKYTRPDDKEGFLDLMVNPFVGELGKEAGFLLIGEDVTERKILESQLAQAQKLESIGQLAAGIAHEINTPTQYVGDNIRFLQESFTDMFDLIDSYQAFIEAAKAGELTPEAIAELEELQEEADVEFLVEEIPTAIAQSLEGVERVSGIVRAMKEFSHPGVDQKTAIDINKAIESTITVARNEWKYVAELETNFDPNLPPVPCLPGEFNQAILNMIINAAHAIADIAGNKNGGGERGKISIQTQRDQGWVEIRISDTGTGIPESARAKIFDPFFTTKEVGHGTGQGLSIARSVIVEKHEGTVTFETEAGRGTTFFIRLPLDIEPVKSVAHDF